MWETFPITSPVSFMPLCRCLSFCLTLFTFLRSMGSVCADTTRQVTTAIAALLSTTTVPGSPPTAWRARHMNVGVSRTNTENQKPYGNIGSKYTYERTTDQNATINVADCPSLSHARVQVQWTRSKLPFRLDGVARVRPAERRHVWLSAQHSRAAVSEMQSWLLQRPPATSNCPGLLQT